MICFFLYNLAGPSTNLSLRLPLGFAKCHATPHTKLRFRLRLIFVKYSGSHLLSHTVPSAVPSAA